MQSINTLNKLFSLQNPLPTPSTPLPSAALRPSLHQLFQQYISVQGAPGKCSNSSLTKWSLVTQYMCNTEEFNWVAILRQSMALVVVLRRGEKGEIPKAFKRINDNFWNTLYLHEIIIQQISIPFLAWDYVCSATVCADRFHFIRVCASKIFNLNSIRKLNFRGTVSWNGAKFIVSK